MSIMLKDMRNVQPPKIVPIKGKITTEIKKYTLLALDENISPSPPGLALFPNVMSIAAPSLEAPKMSTKVISAASWGKSFIIVYLARKSKMIAITPKVPTLLSFIISSILSLERAEKKPSQVSESPSTCNPPVAITAPITAPRAAISLFIKLNK